MKTNNNSDKDGKSNDGKSKDNNDSKNVDNNDNKEDKRIEELNHLPGVDVHRLQEDDDGTRTGGTDEIEDLIKIGNERLAAAVSHLGLNNIVAHDFYSSSEDEQSINEVDSQGPPLELPILGLPAGLYIYDSEGMRQAPNLAPNLQDRRCSTGSPSTDSRPTDSDHSKHTSEDR